MPRVLRWTLVLFVLTLTAAIASAQPSGGGAGQATPVPGGPATRPPIVRDFQDVLDNPGQAWAELRQLVESRINEFVIENRARIDANTEALPGALTATVTRVVALALGVVLLIFPSKTKVWAWLFLGAVVGLVVSQLPVGDDIQLALWRSGEMSFLRQEPLGTLALVGMGAFLGLIVLSPAFFIVLTGAGSLAGAALAAQLTGGSGASLSPAALAIGGSIGFIIMAVVVSRGSLLIPLAIGAGLVVFAAGLGPMLALPMMVIAGFFAVARSTLGKQRLKRDKLPTLQLQEGKVAVSHDKRQARDHLHEILPAMADDRDNPLIKR